MLQKIRTATLSLPLLIACTLAAPPVALTPAQAAAEDRVVYQLMTERTPRYAEDTEEIETSDIRVHAHRAKTGAGSDWDTGQRRTVACRRESRRAGIEETRPKAAAGP